GNNRLRRNYAIIGLAMSELTKKLLNLYNDVKDAQKRLSIAGLETELNELRSTSQKADFWSDRPRAEDNMKRQARISEMIEPWQSLQNEIDELEGLVK